MLLLIRTNPCYYSLWQVFINRRKNFSFFEKQHIRVIYVALEFIIPYYSKHCFDSLTCLYLLILFICAKKFLPQHVYVQWIRRYYLMYSSYTQFGESFCRDSLLYVNFCNDLMNIGIAKSLSEFGHSFFGSFADSIKLRSFNCSFFFAECLYDGLCSAVVDV